MVEMVRCKSCGYVIKKSGLKTKCPACGVPRKLFEPYTDPLSPRRRLLLTLDFHPILAHFPQAFTFSILVLCLFAKSYNGPWLDNIMACLKVICIALPLVVILTFAAGIFDGRIRFRRSTTPLLIRKMLFGGLFFFFSLALMFLSHSPLFAAHLNMAIIAAAGAFVCSSILGWIGARLLNSAFPG